MSRGDEIVEQNATNITNNSIPDNVGQGIYIKGLRLRSKCVYIGKVKNNAHYVEIRSDRILFGNLHNAEMPSKYNITIPYNEMTAMRYCFCSDVATIFIQPIHDAYTKLSNWLNTNRTVSKIVPENFIMILFDQFLSKDEIKQMEKAARECKIGIKIIEINTAFALDYLNKPNKNLYSNRSLVTENNFKKIKIDDTEVIHLDDDEEEKKDNNILNQAILRYPENESKPIILYGNDLNCLRDGHYLNDNIMNFYLKFYQYNGNITQDIVVKIHIYDALFATHLLNVNTRKRRFTIDSNYILCSYDSLGQIYHSVLKKWTKDIDIFAKDFLLIPLVKDGHWFLIILCYIGSLIKDFSGILVNKNQAFKKPTIIFMDSLNNNNINKNHICQNIFSYLILELKEKRGITMKIEQLNFKRIEPKVPQQCNYYDCGLFVLEYIERFLKCPEEIFQMLLNNISALQTWFDPRTLDTKRAKIQQTILNLLPPENAKELEKELLKIQLINFNEKLEKIEGGEDNGNKSYILCKDDLIIQ